MPAPALADATVTYHGLGTTYALAVTPKGSGMLRVVAGCMSLHIARADDVEHVAEHASAQQQNRGLLTGTYGLELSQRVAPDAFGVVTASGAKLGSQSHVECAHDVGTSKGRQERGPWELRRQEPYGVLDNFG